MCLLWLGHIMSLFHKLHCLPAQFKMTYKALHGTRLGYFRDYLFTIIPTHPLRSSNKSIFWVPSIRECHLAGPRIRAFFFLLWGLLFGRHIIPTKISLAPTWLAFCNILKTWFYHQALLIDLSSRSRQSYLRDHLFTTSPTRPIRSSSKYLTFQLLGGRLKGQLELELSELKGFWHENWEITGKLQATNSRNILGFPWNTVVRKERKGLLCKGKREEIYSYRNQTLHSTRMWEGKEMTTIHPSPHKSWDSTHLHQFLFAWWCHDAFWCHCGFLWMLLEPCITFFQMKEKSQNMKDLALHKIKLKYSDKFLNVFPLSCIKIQKWMWGILEFSGQECGKVNSTHQGKHKVGFYYAITKRGKKPNPRCNKVEQKP